MMSGTRYFQPDEPATGVTGLNVGAAIRDLVASSQGGILRRLDAVCGPSFQSAGWRRRINAIIDAGRADLLLEALDYIERSRDPRITDLAPVREPAKYMTGCIKNAENRLARGARGRTES